MSTRVLPLLALFAFLGCGPKAATEPHAEAPKSRPAAPDADSFLDPEPAREVSAGKLFSPDGSIQTSDQATTFRRGTPILLAVESGDLLPGTTVTASWTGPGGVAAEQWTTVIGGETHVSFTAPSADWPAGAARVVVRIGPEGKETFRRELSLTVDP